MNFTKIPEFFGIQQQKDGTLLNIGTARESVNMETGDGNLTVAEAFHVVVNPPVTEEGETWTALFAFERSTSKDILVACSSKKIVFCTTDYTETADWQTLLNFSDHGYAPSGSESAYDAQLARIWNTDYILIATGSTPIIKAPIDELLSGNPVWEWFGSGVYYLMTPLTITNVDTTDISASVITVAENALVENSGNFARTRALVYGIYIMDGDDVKYLVYPNLIGGISDDGLEITVDLTGMTVTTSNTIQLRGGVSDKHVSSVELYRDRLWSSGDPENPSRLYWSCAAGEGRTIEDWVSDDYYEDASGGHVDVGVADGDKIAALKAMSDCILIFKVNSVWRLYGDRPSNYTLERISDEVGAFDDHEIVTKYGTPYWMTSTGLFYSNGASCLSVDNEVDYLKDLFWNVVGSARRSACSVPALRKLFFSIYSTSVGKFVLTRDTVTGAYLTFNGANINDIASASDDVLFLCSDGAVLNRDEGSEMLLSYDTGAPLDAVWKSQVLELNTLYENVQFKTLLFRASGGRIRITIHTDVGETSVEVVPSDMLTDVIRIPVNMAEARYAQITIHNVNGSRFKIEGGMLVWFEKRYGV